MLRSSASRPSFTTHTALPPFDERTVIFEVTKIPRSARCFFVFSSDEILTILISCPMGASISGIFSPFGSPMRTMWFFKSSLVRTYLVKKQFAVANFWKHFSTLSPLCQQFKGLFLKKVRHCELFLFVSLTKRRRSSFRRRSFLY